MAADELPDATKAFLAAVQEQDKPACENILTANPAIAEESIHVAATLGNVEAVQRLVRKNPGLVRQRAGQPSGEPLLWLCYSPFHGESAERDDALLSTTKILLSAGADPETRDERYGVPALYGVTGMRSVPRIARMLLESGASPNDGESVFHAAENFHLDALELLWEFKVDLNHVGDWGNTPLYFLLRYKDADDPEMRRGIMWLLEHGADPNVLCTREQESSLHVAIRRRQSRDVIEMLIRHGADVNAPNGSGVTPWVLSHRIGSGEIRKLLEAAGAARSALSPHDELVAACAAGDVERARTISTPELVRTLDVTSQRALVEAAEHGQLDVVRAFMAAGLSPDILDEHGVTALHRACLEGRDDIAMELLRAGANTEIRDPEHNAKAIGWATFGADFHAQDTSRRYAQTLEALLEAGAQLEGNDYMPSHEGAAAVLRRWQQLADEAKGG